MIEITNITTTAPNALQKAKREKPWITRLAARVYRIVPRRRSKSKRIVTFTVAEGRRFADCRDALTNEVCPSVANDRCCYHVGKAYLKHLTNARRDRDRKTRRQSPPVTA